MSINSGILTSGFGRTGEGGDVRYVLGDEIFAQVLVEDVIQVTVEEDETPFVSIESPVEVLTTVQLEDAVVCTVEFVHVVYAVVSQEGDCMSANNNPVKMFRGNNRDITVTANWPKPDSVPVDLTGAKITMTVKERASDADTLAVLQKKNAAAGGSDAEIDVFNPTGGQLTAHIVPADTVGKAAGVFLYDVQAVLNTGKVLTLVQDKFILKADITHETA